MNRKKLCFNLYNTFCTTQKNLYINFKPKQKVIKLINQFYNESYYIKIFTSRYMDISNENIKEAKKRGFKLTKNQLKLWGVKYHDLIFGKTSYDCYLDDKSYKYKKNWYLNFKKYLKNDF